MAGELSTGHKKLSKNNIFFEIFINNKLSYMREILNLKFQRTYKLNNKKKARMIFMPYEIYLPINNYQGHDYTGKYEVSNLGNVRNMKTGKVLKAFKCVTNTGYMQYSVNLFDTDNKRHTETVARLVISTFKANSNNLPQVGHLNDDSSDNRLNNLYYTTAAENNTHNGRHLRVAKKAAATMKSNGTYTEIAEKNKIKVKCIELNQTFDSAADAALWLNKKNGAGDITKCCTSKRKSAYGYTWKYYTDEGDAE